MFSGLKTRLAVLIDKLTITDEGMFVTQLPTGEMVIFPVGEAASQVMREHFPKDQRRFMGGYVLGDNWKTDYDAVQHHPDFPGLAFWTVAL